MTTGASEGGLRSGDDSDAGSAPRFERAGSPGGRSGSGRVGPDLVRAGDGGTLATPEGGSRATVRLRLGDAVQEREGRVVRSSGEVDQTGRMSEIVVSVEDPYNLRARSGETLVDFEVGSFVEVLIHGRVLKRAIPLPAEAVQSGPTVWVASPANRLERRRVEIARRDGERVLVTAGIEDGELVVLSAPEGAVAGMEIRPRQVDPEREQEGEDEHSGRREAGGRREARAR